MKLSYEDVKDVSLLIIKNIPLLIKKFVSRLWKIINPIFVLIILLLLIFYIINFFIIAIGNIAVISGLYKFSGAHFDWLHEILQYFPRYEVDIIYAAGIIVMLLLWLLLLGIFKEEKGIVILPFQIDPGDKNYDGNVIAEMLIAELKRIIRIHSLDNEKKRDSETTETYPAEDIKEKAHFLELDPKGENIDKSIQAIGTLGLGSTSIPIGSMLILLRNICPGADSGVIISGCLHKSGSDICLSSYMKKKNKSWKVHKEIKNAEKISNEELSALVRELAYNIYYELLKLQSKQKLPDVRKRLLKLSNPSGKATENELPNWEVLKYYTEARDALQTYNITKEMKYLDLARFSGLKASSVDPYYNNPLYLLYNVGIAYINNLNKPDYREAERLARYIVAVRPDSPRVWYSWGVALSFLAFDKEAIDCFDHALFFDNYETEKVNKIAKDIYFMMAISLRDLKHYDESIMYFLKYLSEKDGKKNGYAWGHYGITLEAKAKLLDKYVFRWEKIPGDPGIDEKNLKKFLMDRHGIKTIEITKEDDKTINIISHEKRSISLKLNDEKPKATRATLKIDNREKYEFKAEMMADGKLIIFLDDETLNGEAKKLRIEWNKIPGDPGIDEKNLKKFLMDRHGIKTIEITKEDDKRINIISHEKRSISLELTKATEAILKIDYKGIDEFRAEMVDGELIINLDDETINCEAEKLRAEAEEAFRKAIEFRPDFVPVHAALARIYQKKYVLSWEKIPSDDRLKLIKFIRENFEADYFDVNWINEAEIKRNDKNEDRIEITKEKKSISFELNKDKTYATLKIGDWTERYPAKKEKCELKVYLKDPSQECDEAKRHKQRRKQTEYNRACYEINCGDKTRARELLETAIEEKPVSHEWLEDDPDWDLVRDEQWFKELLKQYERTFDVNDWILGKAIRNKLDKESGKSSLSYCQYDIVDPKTLAKKILLKSELNKKEKECLNSYYDKLNIKTLSKDLSFNPGEPYSIQKNFIEKKVEISGELKEVLCNILNKYVTQTGNDVDKINKMKYLEKVSSELNKRDFLELSEGDKKDIEDESYLVRARFYAVSGNVDDALKFLNWAFKYEKISKEEVDFEPDFEFIRDKPEFKEIMEIFSESERVNS